MTRSERLEEIRKRNQDTAIYDAGGAHRNIKDHQDVAWLLSELERVEKELATAKSQLSVWRGP